MSSNTFPGKSTEAAPLQPIPRNDDTGLPLSYAQQRLWFFDRLLPQSAIYNIPVAFQLYGALQGDLIEKSLNEIIKRHEVLRTTFIEQDGRAIQLVHDDMILSLDTLDLRDLSALEKEKEVKRLAQEDAATAFELSQGPLMRAHLIQLEEKEFVLLLNMHHIVSDGYSMDIFVDELTALYESFKKGESPSLPGLPIQYADYAVWQRETLEGKLLEKQLSYWKKQLSGSEPLLALPTDRPRPAVQTYDGAHLSFTIPDDVAAKLRALSRQEGVTLFMTLMAAFKCLLYRYTGQKDILVGTPVAGRTCEEIEGLIGFFVNTLVIRTQVSDDSTFLELLGGIRETALDAFANQEIPFEKLVDELQIERSLSRSPLFQVMFSLQNASTGVRQLDEISVKPLEFTMNQTAKFDLSLTMIETENGLKGVFEYSTDLFDSTTMERMAAHMSTLLQSIAQQPRQNISVLPIMHDEEKKQLLTEWNQTSVDYPRGKTVHQLFAEMAAQWPDRPAVVASDANITYAELDRRANQLANYLRKQGVGYETPVGICMERSVEMFIGLLGILKAGAAYVPMDPSYPQERLAFMMRDARMPVVLTQEDLKVKLSPEDGTLICLDRDWPMIAEESERAPEEETAAEHLAYVIYTSGSTGLPKGVEIEHGSLLNLVEWHQRTYGVTVDSRATQMAGTAFDASVWEIWPYLTKGSTLLLPPEEIRLVPEQLRDWLVESGVTISFLPTPLAESMLSLEWPADAPLRYLLTGGDKLHHYPSEEVPFTLVNHYGPTENTVVATAGVVPVQAGQTAAPSIGRPIDNVQVYVLDEHMQPVPVGVPGELYISGNSLARGYLNRPDLTAERFLPHPFSAEPGARLYKTGDVVRYLPDGSLEFIGRGDHQTSIRGFRVELGEIETVLYGHPAVRETVVLAREDVPGIKRLAAYLVTEEEQEVQADDLRAYLKEKLPEYMVPSAFVMMDRLPLTPNGKVDRSALPVPDYSQKPGSDGGFVAPETFVEKKLAEIWREVLGVEEVGIHDNFFELGGDSILSIQIVSKANQAGLHLTPKQLFENQTIAEIAATVMVDNALRETVAEQGEVTGTLPLTPIQQWFFEQELVHVDHWNQSVMLKLNQPLDIPILEQALHCILKHHDGLRLRFRQVDGKREQYNEGLTDSVPLWVENLSAMSETEQKHRMVEVTDKAQASLSLSEGPLMRAVYFKLAPEHKDQLFIAIHHLAVDGVSWRIILEDLHNLCQQLRYNQKVQLPAKTTSFKQWAHALEQYAKTVDVDEYWVAIQPESLPVLLADNPEGSNTEADVEQITLSLDAEETKALLQTVPAAYRTQINDVLLSALTKVICRWTGKKTMYLTLEGHGREDIIEGIDLSRTVGWFTSMYPVLLQLDHGKSWGDTLKSVKEQLRSIPNKGIPYGICRYLGEDQEGMERLKLLPQPQISFNYLGQFDQGQSEHSLFELIPNWSVSNVKGDEKRAHLIDIIGSVTNEQLQVTWMFSRDIFKYSTLEAVALDYMEALRGIITHCRTEEAGGYTPSDFPLAKLGQRSIDRHLGCDHQIDDVYPLTPLQEGMLFHSLYAQEEGDYVVQLVMKLSNDLDISAFEQAWKKVVNRHAVLRTSFVWEAVEKPHQIVHKQVEVCVEHHDWRHVPIDQLEERLLVYLTEDRKRNFDIVQAPLMRWGLFRLNDGYRFIWSFHNALLDGWSVPLVLKDWQMFYRAIYEGKEAKLKNVPPFASYIAWLQRV
ncbi:non-ribosomal peptide synthetase [Paenactinomyces guangxiensis]|uniref:non-ribosomal peptide synthetase n=1 Tax=Paenactinomyces guangxiensis TaxID=1490290 RepID=UPI0028683431|nr:non-ribosomal peptide synthetase [Paenactinomyces guangxiensis]